MDAIWSSQHWTGLCQHKTNMSVLLLNPPPHTLLLESPFCFFLCVSFQQTHTHTLTQLCFVVLPSLSHFYSLLPWLNPLVWSIIDDPRCPESSGEILIGYIPTPIPHTHTHAFCTPLTIPPFFSRSELNHTPSPLPQTRLLLRHFLSCLLLSFLSGRLWGSFN